MILKNLLFFLPIGYINFQISIAKKREKTLNQDSSKVAFMNFNGR